MTARRHMIKCYKIKFEQFQLQSDNDIEKVAMKRKGEEKKNTQEKSTGFL